MVTLIPVEDVVEGVTATCAPSPSGLQDARLSAENSERAAAVLKAIADPVRLRLFAQLAFTPGETCVCDLPDVGVSQPTVSHHLRKLRDAGLIDSERRGTWVYYRATDRGQEVAEIVRALT
jgi:ArsR family transcriptional regulator